MQFLALESELPHVLNAIHFALAVHLKRSQVSLCLSKPKLLFEYIFIWSFLTWEDKGFFLSTFLDLFLIILT